VKFFSRHTSREFVLRRYRVESVVPHFFWGCTSRRELHLGQPAPKSGLKKITDQIAKIAWLNDFAEGIVRIDPAKI
jgi:hypothetical protein